MSDNRSLVAGRFRTVGQVVGNLRCATFVHQWLNENGGGWIVCTEPAKRKCYRCGYEDAE